MWWSFCYPNVHWFSNPFYGNCKGHKLITSVDKKLKHTRDFQLRTLGIFAKRVLGSTGVRSSITYGKVGEFETWEAFVDVWPNCWVNNNFVVLPPNKTDRFATSKHIAGNRKLSTELGFGNKHWGDFWSLCSMNSSWLDLEPFKRLLRNTWSNQDHTDDEDDPRQVFSRHIDQSLKPFEPIDPHRMEPPFSKVY